MADYDGDGDPDVYVTRYGPNTLWRNDRGHFTDVTAEAGVGCGLWSLGAAFADHDGDGDLDLFVARYFTSTPPRPRSTATRRPGRRLRHASGLRLRVQPDVLYRNDGGGRFTDVTARAGVAGRGRGMGVVASDFDGDGRVDFLVANDACPTPSGSTGATAPSRTGRDRWASRSTARGRPRPTWGSPTATATATRCPTS